MNAAILEFVSLWQPSFRALSNHSGPTTLLSRRYPVIDLSTIAPHDHEWLAQHWVNSNKAWQKNLALGCHTTLNAHTSACMLPGTSLEHVNQV